MTDLSEPGSQIGTLGEKSLHAALKEWYARPGDLVEVPVDGYVVDIVRGDLLIEIQTRNFAAIRDKLTALITDHPVRLVHPIAREKWIVRTSGDGRTRVGRRKSPKRGRVEDVFDELVRLPRLVCDPSFSLEVLFIAEEEVRRNDGRGSWRRKGWSIYDHHLLDVIDRALFRTPADFVALLPSTLLQPFTNRDLARVLGLRRRLAQRMTYCLRKMGVLTVAGRRRDGLLYTCAGCAAGETRV